MGTRRKDIVEFDYERLASGIYKVTPREALKLGECCFFYTGTNLTYGGGGGHLFDFGVDPPLQ